VCGGRGGAGAGGGGIASFLTPRIRLTPDSFWASDAVICDFPLSTAAGAQAMKRNGIRPNAGITARFLRIVLSFIFLSPLKRVSPSQMDLNRPEHRGSARPLSSTI